MASVEQVSQERPSVLKHPVPREPLVGTPVQQPPQKQGRVDGPGLESQDSGNGSGVAASVQGNPGTGAAPGLPAAGSGGFGSGFAGGASSGGFVSGSQPNLNGGYLPQVATMPFPGGTQGLVQQPSLADLFNEIQRGNQNVEMKFAVLQNQTAAFQGELAQMKSDMVTKGQFEELQHRAEKLEAGHGDPGTQNLY